MNDLTTLDQCVARQREIEKQLAETKDKPQRQLLKIQLDLILGRMRELKAERKARAEAEAKAAKAQAALTVPKSQPPAFTAVRTPTKDVEVIMVRRPSRPPSRPPEAVLPIPRETRQPRAFTDLRAEIAADVRRR